MLRSNDQTRRLNRDSFKIKNKTFDRCVQREKRKFWRQKQNEAMALVDTDSKDFWKTIGRVGVGD